MKDPGAFSAEISQLRRRIPKEAAAVPAPRSEEFLDTEKIRIALVGNGPVGRVGANLIDGFNLVVRINRGNLCGAAGRRTDLLVLRAPTQLDPATGSTRPINRLALKGARELWFVADPSDAAEVAAAASIAGGRPHRLLGTDIVERTRKALRRFQPEGKLVPSMGAIAVRLVGETYPDAEISVFGFSHEGARWHDWDAERRLMEELMAAKRLVQGIDGGAPSRLPVGLRIDHQLRRALSHLRVLRF